MVNPFDCKIQTTATAPKVINRHKINDRVISQIIIGIATIIASSVPLVPDVIPANQNPISRQAMVTILSTIFEYLQLEMQNIVRPKTTVEKGTGLPENISNLPRKFCVTPNLNAKLCEKIIYTKNVIVIEILAYFSTSRALILRLLFGVNNIINPIIGIDTIGLKASMEAQGSL